MTRHTFRIYGILRLLAAPLALSLILCACGGKGNSAPQAALLRGPYLQNVSQNLMIVDWISDNAAPGKVVFTDEKGSSKSVASYVFPIGEGSKIYYYKNEAILGGLKPSSAYTYKVAGVSNPSGESTFYTPPGTDSVNVVVYGDNRPEFLGMENPNHAAVTAEISKVTPLHLLINTGDLVYTGDVLDEWMNFLEIEGPILRRAPLFFAPGNHEGTKRDLMLKLFDTPATTASAYYYTVNYGNAQFIFLDSMTDITTGSRQYNWLKETLERSKTIYNFKYKFVVLHHPLYSGITRLDYDKDALRNNIGPLIENYSVDIVFSGHNHLYEHIGPVNGIHYITTGGGGAPLYDVQQASMPAVAASVYNYVVMNISTGKIELTAMDLQGGQLDRLVIMK
jgi:predicted phosphodiesterase